MPRRTLTFLEDAYRRGVLRRNGSRYEFRHLLLQRHLATNGDSATTVAETVATARQLYADGDLTAAAALLRRVWLYSDEAPGLVAEVHEARAAATARGPVWRLPLWLYRMRAAKRWWRWAAGQGDAAAEAGLTALYRREAVDDHGWGPVGRLKCLVYAWRAVSRQRRFATPEDELLPLAAELVQRGGRRPISRYIHRVVTQRAARLLRDNARTHRAARRALVSLLALGQRPDEARFWALLAPVDGADAPAAAEALLGVPLSDTVRAAVEAATEQCPPGRPLGTAALLDALARHDPLGAWERVWEQIGDPADLGLADAADPDPVVIAPGPTGLTTHPVTADLADSVRFLHRLARRHRIDPVQPGALALALVADPAAGAAQALLSGGSVTHAELLNVIAAELLRVDLPDVETVARDSG